jgi:hypothetical protein
MSFLIGLRVVAGRARYYVFSLNTIEIFLKCIYPRSVFYTYIIGVCCPDSLLRITTAYGLDGPGIESRWGRDFPHLSKPALRPTQPSVQWVLGIPRG